MKNLLLASMLAVAIPAMASADLAKSKGCMACHAVDRKLVGPAFRDVAKKYSAVAGDTASALAVSIRKGGAGKWGPIPMPAQSQLSESQARELAQWILNQK